MTREDKWHLSRSVSVSHLLTTGALIIGALMYVTDIRQDIAVMQSEQKHIQQQIISIQQDNRQMFATVDDKLDQMISIIHTYQVNKGSL
jgi:predicted PurR-regulated permease PerM